MAPVRRFAIVGARVVIGIVLTLLFLGLAAVAFLSFHDMRHAQDALRTGMEEDGRFRQMGTAAAGCDARGGVISRGAFGETYCKIEFRDAGRACTDSSECLGGCIVLSGSLHALGGAKLSGVCKSANVQYGCAEYLQRGRVVRSECID